MDLLSLRVQSHWQYYSLTARFTKPPDCLLPARTVSREHSCQWLHSQPMDIFLFHSNCTSQSHGMAGNIRAGAFVNPVVSCRQNHFPASTIAQFILNGKHPLMGERSTPTSTRRFCSLVNSAVCCCVRYSVSVYLN